MRESRLFFSMVRSMLFCRAVSSRLTRPSILRVWPEMMLRTASASSCASSRARRDADAALRFSVS